MFIGVYLLCIQFYCSMDCLWNALSLLALQFSLPAGGRSELLKSRRWVSVLKGKEGGVGLISSPLTPRIYPQSSLVAYLCGNPSMASPLRVKAILTVSKPHV